MRDRMLERAVAFYGAWRLPDEMEVSMAHIAALRAELAELRRIKRAWDIARDLATTPEPCGRCHDVGPGCRDVGRGCPDDWHDPWAVEHALTQAWQESEAPP